MARLEADFSTDLEMRNGRMLPGLEDLKGMFHGGMDDAQAFLFSQFQQLSSDLKDIRVALDAMDVREEWFTRDGAGVADATGLTEFALAGPPPGFIWVVTSITTVVAGGTTSIGVVYAGSSSPQNAVYVLADADFFAQPVDPIPIFSGIPVTFRITGAPASAKVSATVRGRRLRVPE